MEPAVASEYPMYIGFQSAQIMEAKPGVYNINGVERQYKLPGAIIAGKWSTQKNFTNIQKDFYQVPQYLEWIVAGYSSVGNG